MTILTTRGHKEQYQQLAEWYAEHGLEAKVLPSFLRDCDTASGEHGDKWVDAVRRWYQRGATGRDIHALAEAERGHPLPCQCQPTECRYTALWRFDPDEYDVLIGHYTHGHVPKATVGRTVIIDEFPDAYETTLNQLPVAVSRFLADTPELPYDEYTDLVERRHDPEAKDEALQWFDDNGIGREPREASADGHAAAPTAVLAILTGAENNLGNGWEHATIGDALDGHVAAFDRGGDVLYMLEPPAFDGARNVIGLDGTSTPDLWRLALGRRRLNHRQVLDDHERADYLRDALGLQIVRTTDAIKPYNSPGHVSVDQDAALVEAIATEHGRPLDGLITTATAEIEYAAAGLLDEVDGDDGNPSYTGDHVERTKHYGNVLGSNEFESARLGAVVGSNHYGDGFVAKWGAYAREVVPTGDDARPENRRGRDLSYGSFGDRILRHMREHETLQATMRFGRDGNGAVVYVHTNTLPEWVPIAGEGHVLRCRSEGERQVIDVANRLGEWTTAELAVHPDVDIGKRQVRTHLKRLVEEGAVAVEVDGCGFVWRDTGLHRVNTHGDVELTPVDLDAVDDGESAEVARMETYTWDFRTSGRSTPSSPAGTGPPPNRGAPRVGIGVDPPPEPGS